MEVNVEIRRGAKTLNERDSTRVGFATFEPRLLDQEAGDEAMDDAQQRREQLRMRGEQDAQWEVSRD
jgi:hypothetical protein